MLKKNRKLFVFTASVLCVVLLSFSLFYIFGLNSADSKSEYTYQPKFVGSRDGGSSFEYAVIYETAKEFYEASDCVVIASFKESPKTVVTREEESERSETIESGGAITTRISCAKYQLNVHEVMKGEINEKTITFSQLGQYGSDDGETKLKPNTKYLLFLNERNYDKEYEQYRNNKKMLSEFKAFFGEDKIIYQAKQMEFGIFEIKPDNTLYSYVDYGFAPTFDDKSLQDLVKAMK